MATDLHAKLPENNKDTVVRFPELQGQKKQIDTAYSNAKKNQDTLKAYNSTMNPGVAPTQQIGARGSEIGSGAVAGIPIPNPIVEAPKINRLVPQQSEQAQVGTGTVAGMNQVPNFYDMSQQPVQEQPQPNTNTNPTVNEVKQTTPSQQSGGQQTNIPTATGTTTGTPTRTARTVITAPSGDGRDYSQLRNADVNISQYGDDSSAQYYNDQAYWGGENDKYNGEGVKTSNINYDPNATLDNLDPNYQYGWNAQLANSNDAGYIARRNDQIASALYNAGLTSIDDVRNFLSTQNGFNNSEENERENTIMSVWKRLGDLTAQQGAQGQATPEGEQNQPDGNRPDINIQGDNQAGKIYGKITTDDGNPINGINTLADLNNIQSASIQARNDKVKALQTMNSYDIAVSMSAGTDPYGSQALRDLAQYDPNKYQEVQAELKKIKGMEDVNNIAQGGNVDKTSQIESANESINTDITDRASSNSSERNYDDTLNLLTSKIANSATAQTATQEMLNLNSQMAELEEKINNLPKEASKVFKGDVPQYIVDAFVANRQAQYQSEMNKLQSRYNSAIDLYKTEVSQKQWEAEMDLKERQFQQQINQQNWSNAFNIAQQQRTQYYQGQQLKLSSIKTDSNGKPYMINGDGSMTYLTDNTYTQAIQQQVQQGVNSLMAVYQDGMQGGQCEAFTDNFNQTVYGTTMVPRDAQGNVISGRTYTTAQEKASYVNMATPVVGATAVFNYGPNANVSDAAKKYGHTMLVVGYDADTGMVSLKGSNKNGDEKVYSQTMSLNDFYSRGGVGFWDPAKDAKLQAMSGAVENKNTGAAMTATFDKLITNAKTAGERDVLSTAEAMYETLTDLRDTGALNALIETGDLKKVLAGFDQKKFGRDDGGSVFAEQLQKILSKKSLNTQSQYALNQLYMLVEMKLRNESGAAISSSEWLSNFNMMLPQAWESKDLQYQKLGNWDKVIKRYARSGGMASSDYIPIFQNGQVSTRQTR